MLDTDSTLRSFACGPTTNEFREQATGAGRVRSRPAAGQGRAEVVEDAGVPAAFFVLVEVSEGCGEAFAGGREIGGGAGAAEEERDVVEEARPLLLPGRVSGN